MRLEALENFYRIDPGRVVCGRPKVRMPAIPNRATVRLSKLSI